MQSKFLSAESKVYTVPAIDISEQVKIADVALGRRIYHVRGGCVDCHCEDLAGIKVTEDPAMGTIHGANITPANLSTWTDEQVAAAVRYGVHKSGRSLRFMPSMDWVEMSSGDIADLIAYLRTVPAVDRPSVELQIGPVAKALSVLGEMPVMFPAAVIESLPPGFRDKAAEAPTAEFGRYLAAGCTRCHGAEMRGGKIPGGAPGWPAAASVRLGAWAPTVAGPWLTSRRCSARASRPYRPRSSARPCPSRCSRSSTTPRPPRSSSTSARSSRGLTARGPSGPRRARRPVPSYRSIPRSRTRLSLGGDPSATPG